MFTEALPTPRLVTRSATIAEGSRHEMRVPYGLSIIGNCATWAVREEHLFCNLPRNRPYEVTAEMVERGQANFIARDAFLQCLREYGEVAVRVAGQLSPITTPRMKRSELWN